MTGNRYPRTAKEKAAVGPDVKKFVQNMDKQGAQGGKSEEKAEKVNISGKQIATGALGVGLVAGAVAAARRQGTRDAVTTFLRNLGDKPRTKTYTRPNQGDITPPPVQQQSSVVQETPAFAAYKPADNTKPAPGTILGRDLSPAEKEKALAQAKLQEFNAERYGVNKSGVRAARYEIEKQKSQTNQPVISSQPSAENDEFYTRDELNTMGKIDNLVASIKTGARPQQPKAVATDVKNTALLQSADNKTPKVNKIIGEPTLKSKHDTKMVVHEETRVANTINEYKNEFDNTYGKVLNQITQGNVSGASDRDKRRAERLTNKVIAKNDTTGLVKRFHAAVKQDADIKTRLSAEDASFAADRILDEDTGKAETSIDMGEKGSVLERDMKQMRDVKNLETGQKTALGREIKGRGRLMDVNVTEAPTRKDLVEGETADVQGGVVGPSTVDLSQRATGQNLQYTGKRPAGGQFTSEARLTPTTVPNTDIDPQTGKPIGGVKAGPNVETAGAKPLGDRAPRGSVRKVVKPTSEASRAGEAGTGIYGRQLGSYIGSAMSKEGEYSADAKGATYQGPGLPRKDVGGTFKDSEGKVRLLRNQPGAEQPLKPSDTVFKNEGLTSRERRGMGGLTNEQVIANVRTDRSGKLTKTGRAAREEMMSRNPQGIPLARGGGVLGTGAPSDPTDKKTLGADFTQKANQTLQDITRLPVDEQPAARQKLLNELRSERNLRKGISDVMD